MKQAMVLTLCIFFLIAGSASARIWMDDLEREEIGENWTPVACWMPNPPEWEIEDGVLKGNWPRWNLQMLFLAEYPSPNYTIQVKCRIDEIWQSPHLADAGFVFRSTGPDKITPAYGFGIGSSRAQFGVLPGAGWQYIGTVPENHETGEWYTLKMLIKDDQFVGYVNDRPICKIRDDRGYKGKFLGLSMGSNISASFDDFMITDQVDEDAILNFDVSPEGMLTTTWAGLKAR
jgi:hypothetical protein